MVPTGVFLANQAVGDNAFERERVKVKKLSSFLWMFVIVFNVVGVANAVPVTGWVMNERFSFSDDVISHGTYALNATQHRVGTGFSCLLNLESSPSPYSGACEAVSPVPEFAAMFFFGAGLVFFSYFRKKIKRNRLQNVSTWKKSGRAKILAAEIN